MPRNLYKLTVLRLVMLHIKTIRGSINPYTEGHYKPPWLSDEDVNNLVLQGADSFLFIVSCDRGCVLFMSEKPDKCSVVHRPAPPSSGPVTGTARCRQIRQSHRLSRVTLPRLSDRCASPTNQAMAESDLDLVKNFVSWDTLTAGGQGNSEGNDEVAMAVIMSLLEVDAGLGGALDFSGLLRPLP